MAQGESVPEKEMEDLIQKAIEKKDYLMVAMLVYKRVYESLEEYGMPGGNYPCGVSSGNPIHLAGKLGEKELSQPIWESPRISGW